MMAAARRSSIRDRLPPVRGRLIENAPMQGLTWFRVGGPADLLFYPADVEDLAAFLAARPADVPVTVIGFGSNLLVRDGGIRGVVVRLGREFAGIVVRGAEIDVGAGAMNATVAATSRDADVAGLEFLVGIPGTIGGSLRMNAGAYGREMKDVTVWASVVDGRGSVHRLDAAALGFAYRRSSVPDTGVFVGARLAGEPGDREAIAHRMSTIAATRRESQPIQSRTGGSTFKNPQGAKAWELIDAAGCRGLARGGAKVSELHCNFLVNMGSATAADLEALGEEVRRRVRDHAGVELEWEIRRIGDPAELPEGAT
ncbi:MAG: UDP-N-acetylmuramate dehydrogenase [Alphaproteobacteria bacterium]|nr:UDP-N-acetylmuramate dehydrogenase [Alphaproteobacteria bacterium]